MKCIAIIPTREGSKRIPMKAIINFFGKPIIQYVFEILKNSNVFSRIVLSTDSLDIAKKSAHSDVIFTDLSGDNETLSQKIVKTLEFVNEDYDYAFICYPFSVLLTEEEIVDSFKLAKDSNKNVISICEYPHPPQRAIKIKDKNCFFKSDHFSQKRTQDIEKLYHDAGKFYWINLKKFKKRKRIIDRKNIPFVLNRASAQDVDNFHDLLELKYKYTLLKDGSVCN